jgi:hypothetical protein
MNIENNGSQENIFNLEERYDKEISPLIRELCDKAQHIGVPIFVVACVSADARGALLASSARSGGRNFVPKEFHVIRAIVEGRAEFLEVEP